MYSSKIIEMKASWLEKNQHLTLREYTIPEVDEYLARLRSVVDPNEENPTPKRKLTREEDQFVKNEILMCKISYPYWAERYAMIKHNKGGVKRMKLWQSQHMLLKTMASLEEARRPMLIMNLKARQVGSSTFSESVMTHKVTNKAGITSLVASDEPAKSEFMFNMMERIYKHLPYFLQPYKKNHVKGQQLIFEKLDSHIYVDSGNKRTGGIGQGMTVHACHLSELATWHNPDMITEDLIPAIISGLTPDTFFVMESTAKGKNGAWYNWWKAAKRDHFHGMVCVFIPWWKLTEDDRDFGHATLGWGPSERVMKLALQIRQSKGYSLTRNQMYWWDRAYESYKEDDRLHEFFAEYASDDQEAFQLSGKTVFDTELLNDLMRKAKANPPTVYEIMEKSIIRNG